MSDDRDRGDSSGGTYHRRRTDNARSAEPADVQAEILAINKKARDRSLQVALLVPLLASLLGLANAFRMRRLPDPEASASLEGAALG